MRPGCFDWCIKILSRYPREQCVFLELKLCQNYKKKKGKKQKQKQHTMLRAQYNVYTNINWVHCTYIHDGFQEFINLCLHAKEIIKENNMYTISKITHHNIQ